MFNFITKAIKQFNELLVVPEQNQENNLESNEGNEEKKDFPKDWDDLFCFSYDNEWEIIKSILDDNPSRINSYDSGKSTPLTVATAKGNVETIKLFLSYFNFNINHQNAKGHNALIIASCNGLTNSDGQFEIFNEILKYGTHDLGLVSNNMESSLFLAVTNGHIEISKKLIEYAKKHMDEDDVNNYINGFNIYGVSPIHMAVLKGRIELVRLLIENGADVNAFKKDGSTPLHVSCIAGNTWITEILLKHGANALLSNRFGSTPLHEACIKGQAEIVEIILNHDAELVSLKDKDGSSPLHLACNLANNDMDKHIRVIKVLLDHGANINELDNGKATPLHIVSCIGDKAIEIIKLLLANGSDPTIENLHEWTPIHHVPIDKESHALSNQVLTAWFVKNNPDFLNALDRKKPRAKIVRSEPAELKSSEEAGKLLFDSIIEQIDSGKIKKIVVLTGAGISQNAGIPTYRSSENSKNFNPNDGGKMFSFSMDAIHKDPVAYCESLRKHFYPSETGLTLPTKTHQFISNLQKRNVLLRVFTQNVDSLQEQTGLHRDYIVHAHGSLMTWRCSVCNKECEKDRVWNTIVNGKVPYCKDTKCQNIVRPDVVFFGEGLSVEFHRKSITDFRECDCVIVIGTSLTVYPFAGLLNDAPQHVPRILINQEAVGPFRRIQDIVQDEEKAKDDNNNNTEPIIRSSGKRDLLILSDCDIGTELISKRLNLEKSNEITNSEQN